MRTLVYDGTFGGLLSAIFDVYEYRYTDVTICTQQQRQDSLFGETLPVHTEQQKATRIWEGLKKKLSATALKRLYDTHLSEQKGMEDILLQYAQYVFSSRDAVEGNYSHPAVLYVAETAKKVHREKHRMEAYVRFQLTRDNLYYATVEPDFNVLPLIAEHFTKRYADQQWLIYDLRRKYGLYYDLTDTSIVEIDFNELTGKNATTVATVDDTEELYQHLWRLYFDTVNIQARKNLKLHIKHMPKRYWKYLVEKQPV